MSVRRDPEQDPSTEELPDPDDLPSGSNWLALLRGYAVAVAADAAVSIPWAALAPRWRPQHVVTFLSWLLLAYNIAVGYLGGRSAARAGLSHEDGSGHWNLALAVSLTSVVVELASRRFLGVHSTEALPSHGAMLLQLLAIAALVRFGVAMGTWAQALREGRVTEEDEASAD